MSPERLEYWSKAWTWEQSSEASGLQTQPEETINSHISWTGLQQCSASPGLAGSVRPPGAGEWQAISKEFSWPGWCVVWYFHCILTKCAWSQRAEPVTSNHRGLEDCRERTGNNKTRLRQDLNSFWRGNRRGCSPDSPIFQIFTPMADSWFLLIKLK